MWHCNVLCTTCGVLYKCKRKWIFKYIHAYQSDAFGWEEKIEKIERSNLMLCGENVYFLRIFKNKTLEPPRIIFLRDF